MSFHNKFKHSYIKARFISPSILVFEEMLNLSGDFFFPCFLWLFGSITFEVFPEKQLTVFNQMEQFMSSWLELIIINVAVAIIFI